ncbi:YcaO-like family protein [Kribbella sp. DT2]|uniref:YcaO-like family protein n=1 Tax=Kribbella sp. DT2 TaxID=3393427 RepID=UPI003CEF9122
MLSWQLDDGRRCHTDNFGATHRVGAVACGHHRPQAPRWTNAGESWFFLTPFAAPVAWTRQVPAGRPFRPAFYHRGKVMIGPVFGEAAAVCAWCMALRLAQSHPHPSVFRPLMSGATVGSDDPSWATLLQESVARLAAADSQLAYSCDANDESAEFDSHVVRPVPSSPTTRDLLMPTAGTCSCAGLRTGDVEAVTDRMVGPVSEVRPTRVDGSAPPALKGWVATIGHLAEYVRWAPDVTGSGLAFDDEAARLAAIGEAVERYSGNFPLPRATAEASAEDLRSRQYRVIEPDQDSYIPQRAWDKGVFRRFDEHEAEQWVCGESVTEPQRKVFALAEQVILNFTRFSRRRPLLPVALSGIACGADFHHAKQAATAELVERDATMRWWHGRVPARRLTRLPEEWQRSISCPDPAVDTWFLVLARRPPYVVVAGCAHDRVNDIVTTGYSARTSLRDATQKAAAEVWQSITLSRALLDRGSELWAHVDAGRLPVPTLDWSEERNYAQVPVADMWQLALNLQYYLDRKVQPAALRRLRGDGDVEWPALSTADKDAEDVGWDAPLGSRAAWFDLTTDDVRPLGYRVVRVIDPELVGNSPAGLVPARHPRLRSLQPLEMGPIPHA